MGDTAARGIHLYRSVWFHTSTWSFVSPPALVRNHSGHETRIRAKLPAMTLNDTKQSFTTHADETKGTDTAALDVEDVATRFQVSTRTVQRLVAVGAIGYFRVGNRIRFRPGDLDSYIARTRVPPVSDAQTKAH